MADPNIIGVTSIYGRLDAENATFGTVSTIGASIANKSFKVNSITVANTGTVTTGINVYIDIAGTNYYLAYEIDVPVGTTLVVTDKNTSFYLGGGQNLRATCTTSGGTCSVICSYEEIDDA